MPDALTRARSSMFNTRLPRVFAATYTPPSGDDVPCTVIRVEETESADMEGFGVVEQVPGIKFNPDDFDPSGGVPYPVKNGAVTLTSTGEELRLRELRRRTSMFQSWTVSVVSS